MAMPTHIATEAQVPSPLMHQYKPPMETVIRPPVLWKLAGGRAKIFRQAANGDYSPRIISGKFAGDASERIAAYDLLEPISSEKFLGGICFDLSDVPVRDPLDSPLASQWYHLEGGAANDQNREVSNDPFPKSCNPDAPLPQVSYTRPKVYHSPKLWYLRVIVIKAHDLNLMLNLPLLTAPEIRVKGQLGF
ncbi:QUIRKY [Olea europaea subsp. europaea]|uniref:QUIRKY n=1 Tax=Olea europaea subsp. europaea TaxID=158383 RepID=A0A8S0TAC5_OLEEU|nr:QUIRKY [Olea europaea subsp. europaea]